MPNRTSGKDAKKNFGRRLAVLREGMGLSQEKFAARLGISQTRYSKYESGRSEAPYDILIEISNVTGQSIDFLIAGRPTRLLELPNQEAHKPAKRAG